MSAFIRRGAALTAVVFGALPFTSLVAQRLDTGPVSANYAVIGPVQFIPAPGIKATLVTPNITAGARVSCFDTSYACDINVQPRTFDNLIKLPAELVEEVRTQFKTGSPLRIVTTAQGVEATYIDPSANAKYRFVMAAMIFRGPAVLRVVAQGPDSLSVNAMMNIARTARPTAAREMLAAQFGQLVAVCTRRMPATAAAGERALAISPFSDAALLAIARLRDPNATLEQLKAGRSTPTDKSLSTYDAIVPSMRERICNELPRAIAAAGRELRMY